MEASPERGAEPEWEMLTLRGLAMTDETASEFTGTLVIHRRGSPEPVESVSVSPKIVSSMKIPSAWCRSAR